MRALSCANLLVVWVGICDRHVGVGLGLYTGVHVHVRVRVFVCGNGR